MSPCHQYNDLPHNLRPHFFDSLTLSCARKKGTAGVENDSIFAEPFSSTTKIKQAKETLCSQGAFPKEQLTTIRNIVEAVIC